MECIKTELSILSIAVVNKLLRNAINEEQDRAKKKIYLNAQIEINERVEAAHYRQVTIKGIRNGNYSEN